MARLNTPFSISGPLAGISFYQRRDLPGTFARGRTGVSKERFFKDPAFANSVREACEGGGRSKAARALRRVLHPLEPVRVGNWQAPLTGTLAPLQQLDSESPYGQRHLLFSRHGHLLEGFCLSRRTPFEQVLRPPVAYTLSKDMLEAQLNVPELKAGVNFFAPAPLPYFRLVGALGVVPDLFYTPQGYQSARDYSGVSVQAAYSDWHPVRGGAPASTLELRLQETPPNASFGLLLAVGIILGTAGPSGRIEAAKYAGSGRIVAVR